MPTLAHRVWPSTATRETGTERAVRNNASALTASRMCFVLSPSSPISAAALYTNTKVEPAWRTLVLVNNGSDMRPAMRPVSSDDNEANEGDVTRTLIPAESRPRTSIRSIAEKA